MRPCHIKISGQTSSRLTAKSGVPHRSILGLVLFIIYANDLLPFVLCYSLNMFAGDFQCLKEFVTQQDHFYLQYDLKSLSQRCSKLNMSINLKTHAIIHFGCVYKYQIIVYN